MEGGKKKVSDVESLFLNRFSLVKICEDGTACRLMMELEMQTKTKYNFLNAILFDAS